MMVSGLSLAFDRYMGRGIGAVLAPRETIGGGPALLVLGRKMDLNAVSAKDLTALPGIGPHRAEKIIGFRSRIGGFRQLEDILSIQGIGPKTFSQIKPFLTLRGGVPRP